MKEIGIRLIIILLVIAIIATVIFFGVRNMKMNEYKNADITLPKGFTITAHTGCIGTEENSVEAMKTGVQNGAQIIEFDVHFDKSGYPVLAHDEPKGNELKLDAAFEFLSKNKNIQANVDMKTVENMRLVQDLAVKYDVVSQIFFTGINEDYVETVRADSPLIPYYLNVPVENSKNTDREYLMTLVKKVKNEGAIGINFNYKSATKELVEFFHENGLLVSIWTVDDEYNMYKILSFEPDNITTRNPDRLSEIVGEIR